MLLDLRLLIGGAAPPPPPIVAGGGGYSDWRRRRPNMPQDDADILALYAAGDITSAELLGLLLRPRQ